MSGHADLLWTVCQPKKLLKGLRVQLKAKSCTAPAGTAGGNGLGCLFAGLEGSRYVRKMDCASMVVSYQSNASFRAEADRGNELVRSRHDDCESRKRKWSLFIEVRETAAAAGVCLFTEIWKFEAPHYPRCGSTGMGMSYEIKVIRKCAFWYLV